MTKNINNWVLISLTFALILISSTAFANKTVFIQQIPRINGISINPEKPSSFLVASFSGVFSISNDSRAQLVTLDPIGLTELVRHPEKPLTLFSSGYRSETEKLGIVRSDDGGKSWAPISKGSKGPVAFYAMAMSPSHPQVIYGAGAENELQFSSDGGRNWKIIGNTPDQVFDIAVSRDNPDKIYLATRAGLFESDTGGKEWNPAHIVRRPTTMVNVSDDGTLRAFIYGFGLVTATKEAPLSWVKSSYKFADRALMDIAVSPINPSSIFGVSDTGVVFKSVDSGESWKSVEGISYSSAKNISEGRKLYNENCIACHGVQGSGEKNESVSETGKNDLPLAPSLNDIGHTWHHSDEQLINTILNGSTPNGRMPAWKENGIDRQKAEDLVAYIKSLWNFRSLSCQGPRHMTCLQ